MTPPTYSVVLSIEAERDLFELEDWVSERAGRRIAESYMDRLETFLAKFDTFPERGTKREELGPGLRTVGYRRRATIVFRVRPGVVEIVRILHGGRDLRKALTSP